MASGTQEILSFWCNFGVINFIKENIKNIKKMWQSWREIVISLVQVPWKLTFFSGPVPVPQIFFSFKMQCISGGSHFVLLILFLPVMCFDVYLFLQINIKTKTNNCFYFPCIFLPDI